MLKNNVVGKSLNDIDIQGGEIWSKFRGKFNKTDLLVTPTIQNWGELANKELK